MKPGERLTLRGQQRTMEWIETCQRLGWPKSSIPQLVDLWHEYHDGNGDLIRLDEAGRRVPDQGSEK